MEYCFELNENHALESLNKLFKIQKDKIIKTKCKIDNYAYEWDKIKKNIHLHEYVYTNSYHRKNVSSIVPVSRSFFKMTEMIKKYNLLKEKKEYRVACLAEAPGGFIQSFLMNDNIKNIDAITLVSDDVKIPYWHKSIVNKERLNFHKGSKGDGDLYDLRNVLSFINTIGKSEIDIVTGDGGFDYSLNYNNQEIDSLKLIYSEIFVAINIQKIGGVFICKIFDIFCEETFQLLHVLRLSYNHIYLYKPCISRLSNSEKYVICIDFKGYNKEIVNKMIHNFKDNKLDYKIDNKFLNSIYHINQKYLSVQINQINHGIKLIKEKNINKYPSKEQIKKAIDWCNNHNIEINQECIYIR